MYFKALRFLIALALMTLHHSASASSLPEDSSSGVIYTYFSIGEGSETDSALSFTLFNDQIEEIDKGGYNVLPLPVLLKAVFSQSPLPPRSIALTFDTIDLNFIKKAAPLLIEKKIPFTIFISPGFLDHRLLGVTWDDIRDLISESNVTIGLTSYSYDHIATQGLDKISQDLNRAKSRVREELGLETYYFAYPYGEISPLYRNFIKMQGFSAAFGQNSGVIFRDADAYALPRFTMTEEFGDIDRLRMTSQALPLPVLGVEPESMIISENPPLPGFTIPAEISLSELKSMTCFASGMGKLAINFLGKNRVEIRLPKPFEDSRGRINCTLPVKEVEDNSFVRWRWIGFLYVIPDGLLPKVPLEHDNREEAGFHSIDQ